MKLNPSLFWDINISELSFEDSSDWIIERVFDRGSLDEVISVINYYGKENVKKNNSNYSNIFAQSFHSIGKGSI